MPMAVQKRGHNVGAEEEIGGQSSANNSDGDGTEKEEGTSHGERLGKVERETWRVVKPVEVQSTQNGERGGTRWWLGENR